MYFNTKYTANHFEIHTLSGTMSDTNSGNPPQKKRKIVPSSSRANNNDTSTLEKVCLTCKHLKPKSAYSKNQYKKQNGPRCKECIREEANEKRRQNSKSRCGNCRGILTSDMFSPEELSKEDCVDKICTVCLALPACQQCEKRKSPHVFNDDTNPNICDVCTATNLYKERDQAIERELDVEQLIMPTFEIPGQYPIWSTERLEISPSFSFRNQLDLETLLKVGTYDLIYYYCVDDGAEETQHNRATKGILSFTKGEDEKSLKGFVSIDISVRKDLFPHHVDLELKVLETNQHGRSGLSFKITNHQSLRHDWQIDRGEEDGIFGEINILEQRLAVRYMPEEVEELEYPIEYAQSIQFENIHEAEALLHNYEIGERYLWLENHLNLPDEVSRLIRKFTSQKPQPVLLFEEDDIHLNFLWDEDHREFFGTCLVARPRKK